MEMPIGDVADRLTILLQKFIHGRKDPSFDGLGQLASDILECLWALGVKETIAAQMLSLFEANVMIWWLETDLRNGKEGTLSLEEVGRRAIEIRNINKQRIAAKNELASLFGDERSEVKINHAST